jgi:hypothetical protein
MTLSADVWSILVMAAFILMFLEVLVQVAEQYYTELKPSLTEIETRQLSTIYYI